MNIAGVLERAAVVLDGAVHQHRCREHRRPRRLSRRAARNRRQRDRVAREVVEARAGSAARSRGSESARTPSSGERRSPRCLSCPHSPDRVASRPRCLKVKAEARARTDRAGSCRRAPARLRTACARYGRGRGTIRGGGAAAPRRHMRCRPARNALKGQYGAPRKVRPPQEAGDPAAPRDIGLLHVDRPGGQHPAEVIEVVAIFAGGHLHRWRRACRTSRGRPGRRTKPAPRTTARPAPANIRRVAAPVSGRKRRWRRRTESASPIAASATSTRCGSQLRSVPIFIFTARAADLLHPAGELRAEFSSE